MPPISEIFKAGSAGTIISELKNKSVDVPDWKNLLKDYEPTKHKIVHDMIGRKDRQRSDGVVEKASLHRYGETAVASIQ